MKWKGNNKKWHYFFILHFNNSCTNVSREDKITYEKLKKEGKKNKCITEKPSNKVYKKKVIEIKNADGKLAKRKCNKDIINKDYQ